MMYLHSKLLDKIQGCPYKHKKGLIRRIIIAVVEHLILKPNFNICLASNYVSSSILVTLHILFNPANNATSPSTPTPHFANKKRLKNVSRFPRSHVGRQS